MKTRPFFFNRKDCAVGAEGKICGPRGGARRVLPLVPRGILEEYFIFQGLERTFQTLERIFQTLECTFQSLKYKFSLSVRTNYIKTKNFFTMVLSIFLR